MSIIIKLTKFKIKLILITSCLTTISFANFDKLILYAKELNLAGFKKQLNETLITLEQKKELLNVISNIIETEHKYWRTFQPKISGPSMGNKIRVRINIRQGIAAVSALLPVVSISTYFAIKNKIYSDTLYNLQLGNIAVPANKTAAIMAHELRNEKNKWLFQFMNDCLAYVCFSGIYLSVFCWLFKHNQKILRSYKRWKKGCKIKCLLTQNQMNFKYEN